MSASLPTKLVPQECAESLMEEDVVATATDEITVLCADGVRIRVDLNLFPSEFLRRLAASDFADKKEVEIPYRADHFYKIYKKYLPAIEEYLQIAPPQLISSHDLLFIRSTKYDDYFYTYHFIIDEKKYQMYFYAGFWPISPHLFGQSIKKNQIGKITIKLSCDPDSPPCDVTITNSQFAIVITKQSKLDFLDDDIVYEGRDLSRKMIEYMLNSEKYKAFINANKKNFIV